MSAEYTKAALHSMQMAEKAARQLGHDSVGSEHLLLGMLLDADNAAAKVLEKHGVEADRIRTIIENPEGWLPAIEIRIR